MTVLHILYIEYFWQQMSLIHIFRLKSKKIKCSIWFLTHFNNYKLTFYRDTHVIEASTRSSSNWTTRPTSFDTVNTTTTTIVAPTQRAKYPLQETKVCHNSLCRNGGTCHELQLPGGALPSCHCLLHFSGAYCEKGMHGCLPKDCYTFFRRASTLDVTSEH